MNTRRVEVIASAALALLLTGCASPGQVCAPVLTSTACTRNGVAFPVCCTTDITQEECDARATRYPGCDGSGR